jgi:DNA-directed RNA polymerase subunit M/transcription elongation factor TFIIS
MYCEKCESLIKKVEYKKSNEKLFLICEKCGYIKEIEDKKEIEKITKLYNKLWR